MWGRGCQSLRRLSMLARPDSATALLAMRKSGLLARCSVPRVHRAPPCVRLGSGRCRLRRTCDPYRRGVEGGWPERARAPGRRARRRICPATESAGCRVRTRCGRTRALARFQSRRSTRARAFPPLAAPPARPSRAEALRAATARTATRRSSPERGRGIQARAALAIHGRPRRRRLHERGHRQCCGRCARGCRRPRGGGRDLRANPPGPPLTCPPVG